MEHDVPLVTEVSGDTVKALSVDDMYAWVRSLWLERAL